MNPMEVVLGVTMFTGVIMSVVFVILYARKMLVSTGEVTIEINGDPEKTIELSRFNFRDELKRIPLSLPIKCTIS